MAKMWTGRTDGVTDKIADDFNSSIKFDSRMYKQDILGSMAHATMLGAKNIISKNDADILIEGLDGILKDIESGKLAIDYTAEDIHMFVEQVLTERVGDVGKKLHTARSRNDQVALDTRMYLRDCTDQIIGLIKDLVIAVVEKAEQYKSSIMSGYTHLQRAQPITFGHHLMTYAMMLLRDIERFTDLKKRIDICPIGSCALAGTTYNTDRRMEAEILGFTNIAMNSIDGVSDRDFCVEFNSASAMLMMHLSRFSEEIILWTSWEFKYVELSDAFTTGSSIMPQKKNSDMAELVRGKTGRVYGNLIGILTMLKGLPLAYNKDMQEDKEPLFDAVDTVKVCLEILPCMLETIKVNKDNMLNAVHRGFLNATDVADYLVNKGVPFRKAHEISGNLVKYCESQNITLQDVTLEKYKEQFEGFENNIYEKIKPENSVEAKKSLGACSKQAVETVITINEKWIKDNEIN